MNLCQEYIDPYINMKSHLKSRWLQMQLKNLTSISAFSSSLYHIFH